MVSSIKEQLDEFTSARSKYIELINQFVKMDLTVEQAILTVRKLCVPPNQLHLFKHYQDRCGNFTKAKEYVQCEYTHPEFYEISRQEEFTMFQYELKGLTLGSLTQQYKQHLIDQGEPDLRNIDEQYEIDKETGKATFIKPTVSTPDLIIDLTVLQQLIEGH